MRRQVFDHRGIGLFVVAEIFVVAYNLVAVAHFTNLTLLDPDRNIAEFLNVKHRVAAERHGFILLAKFVHALHAFFLEGEIAYRERLVNNQNVGANHGSDRKGEPHVHAR